MYGVSVRFHETVRRTHRVAVTAELYDNATRLDVQLRVLAGDVVADRTQAVWRRCTVELVDPTTTLDLDTIDQPVLRLYRGVSYRDGTSELVPLGVFEQDRDADQAATRGRTIRFDGFDQSQRMASLKWDDSYQPNAGSVDLATVAATVITNRIPYASTRLQPTGHLAPTNLVFTEQADPLAELGKLFAAAGHELYVDRTGEWVNRPVPDPETAPIGFTVGSTGLPLLELSTERSRQDTYSAVVVTGERAGSSPVRAIAYDTDPTSPTYYYGPGRRGTLTVQSDLVTSTDQAQDAADGKLKELKNASRRVTLSVVPNPAIEPGDVAFITRDGRRCMIDAVTIPLGSDPMQLTGRHQGA